MARSSGSFCVISRWTVRTRHCSRFSRSRLKGNELIGRVNKGCTRKPIIFSPLFVCNWIFLVFKNCFSWALLFKNWKEKVYLIFFINRKKILGSCFGIYKRLDYTTTKKVQLEKMTSHRRAYVWPYNLFPLLKSTSFSLSIEKKVSGDAQNCITRNIVTHRTKKSTKCFDFEISHELNYE